ncbi:hypothetical protein ACFFX0_06000 [Citricoccus parietis]|uniref:Uncharacterized protein n=1 Tax=Citricoccus parietis TaxID=592307 RepID=A0ABV5FVS4_9MICC
MVGPAWLDAGWGSGHHPRRGSDGRPVPGCPRAGPGAGSVGPGGGEGSRAFRRPDRHGSGGRRGCRLQFPGAGRDDWTRHGPGRRCGGLPGGGSHRGAQVPGPPARGGVQPAGLARLRRGCPPAGAVGGAGPAFRGLAPGDRRHRRDRTGRCLDGHCPGRTDHQSLSHGDGQRGHRGRIPHAHRGTIHRPPAADHGGLEGERDPSLTCRTPGPEGQVIRGQRRRPTGEPVGRRQRCVAWVRSSPATTRRSGC